MLKFSIQTANTEPVEVVFDKPNDITVSCTCEQIQDRKACKHILKLLSGSTSNILSGNESEVASLPEFIKGTDFEDNYIQYKKWYAKGNEFLAMVFQTKMFRKWDYDPFADTSKANHFKNKFAYSRVKFASGAKRTIGKDDKFYYYQLDQNNVWNRINEQDYNELYFDFIDTIQNIRISPLDGKRMGFDFEDSYPLMEEKDVGYHRKQLDNKPTENTNPTGCIVVLGIAVFLFLLYLIF